MLTISKPLSAGQAQSYHKKEFTSEQQSYWSRGNTVQGEWQGRLAANLGDHFKSGQRLSLQNRPTEVAGSGPVCSTLPPPVEASRFWCASFAGHISARARGAAGGRAWH